jgi:hypothetical protein
VLAIIRVAGGGRLVAVVRGGGFLADRSGRRADRAAAPPGVALAQTLTGRKHARRRTGMFMGWQMAGSSAVNVDGLQKDIS